jgi:hypothetical protein
MNILSTFEEAFNIPQSAMEQLKAKIMKGEEIDLFSFLFNLSKDELPNLEAAGPSSNSPPMTVAIPSEFP